MLHAARFPAVYAAMAMLPGIVCSQAPGDAGWRPGAGRDPRSPARAAGPPQDGLGGAGEQVPDAGAGALSVSVRSTVS